MEYIKKDVLLITTSGTTETIDGVETFTIVPDVSVVYEFKINLTTDNVDIGFFNADNEELSNGDEIIYSVSGTCDSRLVELKKYKITDDFLLKYTPYTGLGSTGVDYSNSVENYIVKYFIDNIEYNDIISGDEIKTTFKFDSLGVKSPHITNSATYKIPENENIISGAKINSDVFIERQQLSVFDKNYRLEYIGNLSELETYAGGNFFNIIKNT